MENSRITVDFETTVQSGKTCNLTTVLDKATQEYIKRVIIRRVTSYKPNRKRVRLIHKARMRTIRHDMAKLVNENRGYIERDIAMTTNLEGAKTGRWK